MIMEAYIDYCVWYFSQQRIGQKGGVSLHVLQWQRILILLVELLQSIHSYCSFTVLLARKYFLESSLSG